MSVERVCAHRYFMTIFNIQNTCMDIGELNVGAGGDGGREKRRDRDDWMIDQCMYVCVCSVFVSPLSKKRRVCTDGGGRAIATNSPNSSRNSTGRKDAHNTRPFPTKQGIRLNRSNLEICSTTKRQKGEGD